MGRVRQVKATREAARKTSNSPRHVILIALPAIGKQSFL